MTTSLSKIEVDKMEDGTPKPLSFEMQRWTARICVKIKSFENQFYGKNPKCDVTIYSPSKLIAVDYTENPFDSWGDSNDMVKISPYNGTNLNEYSDPVIALVSPQRRDKDEGSTGTSPRSFLPMQVFIKVLVKYDNNTETLNVIGMPDNFKSGYSYTYNLIVGKDVVTVNSVTVEPWSTAVIEGGTATEDK